MPATTQKQQIAMAIAEHAPEKLYKRNAALKKMTHQQLHDFAATKRSSLPVSAPPRTAHHERTKAYMKRRNANA